jgi:beta-glucosidase
MDWSSHPNVKAIVWPGLAGQESGNALASVVSGESNPSGRLPYTIAQKASDYGVKISYDYAIDYTEKLLVGHRWFDQHNIKPKYEFGYGLSYTTFSYSQLKVKSSGKGDKVTVSATVTVKNAGKVDGAEVVQAYIQFPDHAGEPPKVLRGFEKVQIKSGKSEKVTIDFTKTELSIWDEKTEQWVIPSGKFTVHIGASSRDIRAQASFSL